jgi:GntR family transcriptional regulator, uxu operon transcriptional repressor
MVGPHTSISRAEPDAMAALHTPPKKPGPMCRSSEVAAILRDEILTGQYRAGERLPSERDLVVRFDTSRGVVREAFKKLEQLGIVSIQPSGARVVPITECTLDVLGPLLDLGELPDPKLVDEVLHITGVLLDVAARTAVQNAAQADIDEAMSICDAMLDPDFDWNRTPDSMRRLALKFVEIADHLVLRLILNGLYTTFWERMPELGDQPQIDAEMHFVLVRELRDALAGRDAPAVGDAMRRLNREFRKAAETALLETAQRDLGRATLAPPFAPRNDSGRRLPTDRSTNAT